MKRILSLLAFVALWSNAASAMSAVDTTGLNGRLRAHVQYLASDELKGRRAGSEDAIKAADYICGEWKKIGLVPAGDSSYRQPFTQAGGGYVNLLARIDGNDSSLADEIVVIGAHYDHLGTRGGVIYPGADDNASGVAAVTEMARILLENKNQLARTIYIAAFDGEELGLYGSDHLAEVFSDKNVVLMISADMVGWYGTGGALELEGSGTIRNGKALLTEAGERNGINVKLKKFENSLFTATDTRGFAQQGRATLAVTTGLKSPYHKPEDTADKIDYDGLASVSCFLADLVGQVASQPDYRPSGKVASIHRESMATLGINVGVGSGFLDLGSESALTGRTRIAARAGLDGRVKIAKKFALRAGVGLEDATFWLPALDDVLGGKNKFETLQIDAPADLIWSVFGNSMGDALFITLGGYYNHLLSAKISGEEFLPDDAYLNASGYGLQFGFGFGLGPVTFEWHLRRPLTDLFIDASAYGLPAATRLVRNYFSISTRF